MNIRELAEKRNYCHSDSDPRYYKDKNLEHIIGLSGELCFAKRYNLKPDLEIRPNGDNHIDFKVKINDEIVSSIDVKTAQKAYNLLIKKWEINKCSDILVLAEFKEENNVNFLGWTTKKIMKEQPTKVFSSLHIENYYLHFTKLYDMKLLDAIFSRCKIEQLPQ